MYLHSPYPPVPVFPITNYHNILFRSPEQLAIPDHVMYVDAITDYKLTRVEFIERMYDAATALGTEPRLGGLGLGKESMIGILSDNCLNYITLIHACLIITAPFALFSSYATPQEIKHYLQKSQATHMFVHASLLTRFLPVAQAEGFSGENIFILEGEMLGGVGRDIRSLDILIQEFHAKKIPREPVREAGIDTLAYLIFSSGTSGLPKAVMVSHGNLNFSLGQALIQVRENFKVYPPNTSHGLSVNLASLPLFHTYGIHAYCLKSPFLPSTTVLMPQWNLDLALACIPKYKVTHFQMIPSTIHSILTSPKLDQTDVSSIVSMGNGAAYLPPVLAERLKTRFKLGAVGDGYGMSEGTYSLIVRPPPGVLAGIVEHDPSSSGVLIAGLEAIILRSDGTHCLPGEPGELFVKGENVGLGYYNDPEATKEVFLPNGWLRTGDRFRANSQGLLWFEDRIKDTLKVSGLQVSPVEIENALLAEPSGLVSDVAVAGVQLPEARTSDDNVSRAWVVLTEKGKLLGDEKARDVLNNWVKESLSKYKWLRGGIEFINEIPKNPAGKVMRRTLQAKYNADMTRTKL